MNVLMIKISFFIKINYYLAQRSLIYMKKIIIFAFLLLAPFISGCSTGKEKVIVTRTTLEEKYDKTIDYSQKSLDNYAFSITAKNVEDLIINKESFVLLIGSDVCGDCLTMKPLLIRYILSEQATIHYLNLDSETNNYEYVTILRELNDINGKKIFSLWGTPIFYFINKGALSDEMPKLRSYNSYQNLKNMLVNRIAVSNVMLLKSFNDLQNIELKNIKVLYYSLVDKDGQYVYQEMIAPKTYTLYLLHLSLYTLPSDFLITYGLSSLTDTALIKYGATANAKTDEMVFSAMQVSQSMLDTFFTY